jgi:hypothetical protein
MKVTSIIIISFLFFSLNLNSQMLSNTKDDLEKILGMPNLSNQDLTAIVNKFDVLLKKYMKSGFDEKSKQEVESYKGRSARKLKLNENKIDLLSKWINNNRRTAIDKNILKKAEKELETLEAGIHNLALGFQEVLNNFTLEVERMTEKKKLDAEKQKIDGFKKYQNLKKGACIKVAHSNFNIQQMMLNNILKNRYEDRGYWYQAKVIEVRKTSIIVEIKLEIGGKGGMIDFGDEEVDYRKSKWKKGQFVEIDTPHFIKKCY